MAEFNGGKVYMYATQKPANGGQEILVRTMFELSSKKTAMEMSHYFQYQLGKHIRLIVNGDTLKPKLTYYVPVINELRKEIDAKFLISGVAPGKKRQVIIADSTQELHKINISL